jgi:methyl-accepting chemotaxis protein
MIANLRIRSKLSLIYVAFLLPIAFLVYSVVTDRNVSIDFARKELVGSSYIKALSGTELALHHYRATQDADPLKAAYPSVLEQEKLSGAQLDTAAAYADLDRAMAQVFNAGDRVERDAAIDAALPLLRTLIGRVGDASNLILDPDLDSFYAMDIVVVKLPALLDRIGEVSAAARADIGRANLSFEEKSAFLISQGALKSAIDDLSGDLASAYRGSADGSLKRALDPPYNALTAALEKISKETSGALATASASAAPGNGDAISSAQEAASAALGRFWQVSAQELDRLLEARISRFRHDLVITLAIAGVTIAFAFALLLAVARQITRPLVALSDDMTKLADGDRAVEICATDRRDEVGEMARRVERFKEALIRSDQLAMERASEVAQQLARQQTVAELTRDFTAKIDVISQTVTGRASEVRDQARGLTDTADETSRQSHTVADAAQNASARVETVAAAAEELSASISEVRRQVASAADVSNRAVGQAGDTDQTVRGLADAASRIGEVVALINSIAAQTNLLALNATIEAARAGEAGKGFAVVAAEVKNLATQTANATGEIQAQIAAIQSETSRAVDAIGAISQTIGTVSEINQMVAQAVDQQEAATSEIARNIQQASVGTMQVSNTITAVTEAAAGTRGAASTMLGSAEELARQSEILKSEVGRFIGSLGAA